MEITNRSGSGEERGHREKDERKGAVAKRDVGGEGPTARESRKRDTRGRRLRCRRCCETDRVEDNKEEDEK